MRSLMLRNASAVLAILLVLGSSGLSTSALARGGRGDRLPDNHFSVRFPDIFRDGRRDYEDRTRGLGGRFHRYEGRDMWGHWGTYYGPMIPST